MSKILTMALLLAAACQPAGEQPANQPADQNGAGGTDDVFGGPAEDAPMGTDRGTNGVEGTNGRTPPATTPPTTPGTAQTTPGTAQTPPGASQEANKATAQALQDAHQIHQHQAELARMAKAKSDDPAIEAYADQVAKEHKDADDKLATLADEKGISLESGDAARYQDKRATQERLRELEGSEFEQAYVMEMVEGGEKANQSVATILTSTQDPDVRAYFVELQPVLKNQVDQAKQLRPPQRGTE